MRQTIKAPGKRWIRSGEPIIGWYEIGGATPFTKTDHAHGYWIARQLQREEGYDFVPYPEHFDKETRLWLYYTFGDLEGGLLFQRWEAGPRRDTSVWDLQWAWIAPHRRNKGLLTATWKHLIAKYGEFYVQFPVSRAMRAFLHRPGFHAINCGKPDPQDDGLYGVAKVFG